MYNYNLINPINITYRNQKQNPYTDKKEDDAKNGALQTPVSLDEGKGQRQFPNGNKVQVDYTKNKVNIAQVVEDFKSTIAAINAPKEISDEVHLYLNLVENESKKENPSREIILSNLKNASKISDRFIEESLKKPSTVVEDWVNALFLQNVELKSNPDFVNEDFRVQIPENKKSLIQEEKPVEPVETAPKQLDRVSSADEFQNAPLNIYNIPQDKITINGIRPIGQAFDGTVFEKITSSVPENQSVVSFGANKPVEPITVEGPEIKSEPSYDTNLTYSTTAPLEEVPSEAAVSFIEEVKPVEIHEIPDNNTVYRLSAAIETSAAPVFNASSNTVSEISDERSPLRTNLGDSEQIARSNFVRAKRLVKENGDPKNALKLYNEALELVKNSPDDNLKAAIYFERGRVFDDYDYAEYALKDYNNATKCSDNNLKTHAHLNMGRIYDDYVMFDPAIEQYSLAVETSQEAKNPAGKTRALRYLAGLFADRYDKENTEIFNNLSVDSAYETGNSKIVAKTLMEAAENFEYIGEDVKALGAYKQAAKVLFETEDYAELSRNYEAASDIMERLGNEAKAMNLLSKALLYRQKAELQTA